MAKETKVVLVCPKHNITREFEASHAERILKMKNNGGWQLPEKTNFEFDENGLRYKRNKKADSGAPEQGSDK